MLLLLFPLSHRTCQPMHCLLFKSSSKPVAVCAVGCRGADALPDSGPFDHPGIAGGTKEMTRSVISTYIIISLIPLQV